MKTTIAAYTPPTLPYPPYLNISQEDDGSVVITLREAPGPGEFSERDCGRTISVTFGPEGWADLRRQIVGKPDLTDAQIKHMAERFLCWRLPENFRPDAGISFEPEFNKEYMAAQGKPPMRHRPTGTNLFGYSDAEAMVRHMLEGLPPATETGP